MQRRKNRDQELTADRAVAAPTAEEIARHEAIKKAEAAAYNCKVVTELLRPSLVVLLGQYQTAINGHMEAQGFWESDNTGEKIALMHSELSEALEADRKDLDSQVIRDEDGDMFTGMEEELADAVIRILDFAGHHGLRIGDAICAKIQFNLTRPFKHGKAY